MRAGLAGLILGAGVAFQAAAHPHVFVDTRLDVVFDTAGRAEGVRISWTYDDLFSLVIIMDHEMDADFDGVLTAQELETLRGFDMNWIAIRIFEKLGWAKRIKLPDFKPASVELNQAA